MLDRQQIADLWGEIAQISRRDIFGEDDLLRPRYANSGPKTWQIDVPALGFVGPRVEEGPVALVSVNPAGGKEDASSTSVDDLLYRAFEAVRDADDRDAQLSSFEHMTRCFSKSIPTWTIWRQYIQPILQALARGFDETCYLYLVPFRTKGDAGSKLRDTFTSAGYERNLRPQLDAIEPSLIIAVDRPSERVCRDWAANAKDCEVFYFTRKRDAHAERRELLAELTERKR